MTHSSESRSRNSQSGLFGTLSSVRSEGEIIHRNSAEFGQLLNQLTNSDFVKTMKSMRQNIR